MKDLLAGLAFLAYVVAVAAATFVLGTDLHILVKTFMFGIAVHKVSSVIVIYLEQKEKAARIDEFVKQMEEAMKKEKVNALKPNLNN